MTKVIDYFRVEKRVGEIGIEIEVEAGRGDVPIISNGYWTTVPDGSLRGASAEYKLNRPVKRKEINKVLNNLKKAWGGSEKNFLPSLRTSTHIHINMQEQEMKEVVSFFILYSIFEDLFVKFCGKEREGNLFCLRTKDAEWLIEEMVNISTNGIWNNLSNNNIRYASVNLSSLARFGSMEFRAMRGTTDFSQIKLWINMLLKLKDNALAYESPRNILELFSQTGEHRFLEEIMGDYSEVLQCPKMGRLIREGMWRVQELAFSPVNDKAIPTTKRKRRTPIHSQSLDEMIEEGRETLQVRAISVVDAPHNVQWNSTNINFDSYIPTRRT